MRLFLFIVVVAIVLGVVYHAQIEQHIAQASAHFAGGATLLGGVGQLGHATAGLMMRIGNALSH